MFPVGIDVSKNTLDLFMLYDGIKGRIKTRNIQNNRHSVENILRWLRSTHRVNACHFCLNFFFCDHRKMLNKYLYLNSTT